MVVGHRLEQRLGQALVMTPQLQQAIKLLQLSNLDLAAYVEQEVESNPLLERVPGDDTGPAEAGPAAGGEELAGAPDPAEMTGSESLAGAGEAALGGDDGELYDGGAPAPAERELGIEVYGRGGGTGFDDGGGFEDSLTRPRTLREHLEEQLDLDVADPTDRVVCRHLIDALDEAGYVVGDCGQIAHALGCPPARVERALALMQRCEPAGVFARSLGECLALQLADQGRLTPPMQALVANLDLVAGHALDRLAELCAVAPEEVIEMVAELRRLDPKPGLVFDSEPTQTVIADVIVRPHAGGWSVELNSDTLPKVLVNNRYYSLVGRAARTKQDRAYLSERLQTANWLVKALEQRANTILKVATELVRQQDGFLRKGIMHLRPLTLRDIADAVSMHESTISRVTTNKYMATPRGIFELKYLFSSAIPSSNGGASHSSEAIRHRIKELIDNEPADDVLSDDRLVAVLEASGIDIARRTVAKYRESMRIPSSVQRRRARAARI